MRLIHLQTRVLLAGILGASFAGACEPATPPPRSYLSLPTLRTTPYVWHRTVGTKHLVVLGTLHSHDRNSPMYGRLEKELRRARPEVVIHESLVPADMLAEPLSEAIYRAGDLGFTAQLATKLGARLDSGDAPAHEEIKALLKKYQAQDVFAFLVAQRFVGSDRPPDASSLERDYPTFVRDYLEANGMPLKEEWKTWKGFRHAFALVAGRSFSASTWNPKLLHPRYATGILSDLARSSCEIRDTYLVADIQRQLKQYDRVAVVFGSAHVFAIEPELDSLFPSP